MIPYGHQNISEEDIQAVVDVLRSDWLTQGPFVERFEHAISEYCGAKYSVATCNATAALHLACRALELAPNDYVWTSPNTFAASANCARYCGAKIDFVDIDPKTYNLSVTELEKKLAAASKENKLPKLVIPVHFAGQSCDMAKIKFLSDKYGFYILEDASHAIGGSYRGHKIGGCQYSDMTVFSFHPAKIITTGEGGMVLTNNENLHKKLKLLVSHGITKNPELMQGENHGPWYAQQLDLGYNYRITDFQCALGLSQFKRIDDFVTSRHKLAARYNNILKELPLVLPFQTADNYSAYHLYVIKLQLDQLQKTRKQIITELREANVGAMVHYIPVHTHPYYQKLGFAWGDFPEAEQYYQATISLPLYPQLTMHKQDYVISKLIDIIK
jgi:UDP-4-amino-4,6-dideoxy-N-acetyl-beta-L-altrosamine transaminase